MFLAWVLCQMPLLTKLSSLESCERKRWKEGMVGIDYTQTAVFQPTPVIPYFFGSAACATCTYDLLSYCASPMVLDTKIPTNKGLTQSDRIPDTLGIDQTSSLPDTDRPGMGT